MSKSWAISLFCLGLTVFLPSTASAQSSDDVHIAPRTAPQGAKPGAEVVPIDSARDLYSQSRPFRVNVDLVLVPVTVTDPKQQPVTTLVQKDFALFEDEKPSRFGISLSKPSLCP